ncbi:hypothetical protein GbCGDNIH6_8270 [Granulibacter bethesdensis]|nr:hypothetical protein GbCGDNIH6_8270 [Granulibacter bethesdensis]
MIQGTYTFMQVSSRPAGVMQPRAGLLYHLARHGVSHVLPTAMLSGRGGAKMITNFYLFI